MCHNKKRVSTILKKMCRKQFIVALERSMRVDMQVLLISEAYIGRTLLDYFKQNNKHTFILLKSNHPEIKNCVEDNVHVMHLRDALAVCDCVYILEEEKLPSSLIQQCQETAQNRGIPVHYGGKHPHSKEVEIYLNNIQ